MGKKNKPNPRTLSIKIDPINIEKFEGLALDFNQQKIWGINRGETLPLYGESRLQFKRERSNPKNNGKKILHESISPTDDVWFSSTLQTLSYNHLIAVDTNTNYLNGSSVSITAAYHVIPQYFNNELAYCHARILTLLEMWNVIQKPENLGWWQVLQAINKSPDKLSGKIGLIVDSDLGNHDSFNARRQPIILDYYLPDNVNLIYGSDKGGAEHLSTKMIKYCHNLAADLFKNENLVMNIANLQEGVPGLYTHFRQWDIENMELREFANTERVGVSDM